jgi:hypothetical protein
MADEELNHVPDEPETTAIETDELPDPADEVTDDGEELPEEEAETKGEGEEEAPTGEEDDASEFEDVEYEGKQYKLPKELREALLRQSDYTKKTQEVAERRRELETFEQSVRQQAVASEEELTARATFVNAQKELEKFKDVNWREWHQQDPMAAQDAKMYVDGLRDQMNMAVQTVNTKQHERSLQAQQDFAKRLEETKQFAAKEIKGWSPEVAQSIEGFMAKEGIDAQTVQANMSPKFLRLMYLASLGEKALTQATTPKPKQAAPKQIQPLQSVKSKSAPGPTKALADMDMEEYVAARRKGIGG